MLIYRLIFGTLLIVGALLLVALDAWLDTLRLEGVWQQIFYGRAFPTPGLPMLGLALVLIPLGCMELAHIFRAKGMRVHRSMMILTAVACCIAVYATPMGLSGSTGVVIIASIITLGFIVTMWWHAKDMTIEGVVAAAGATMFAATYLGLMAGFFLAMRRWHSAWEVLAVIILAKVADIGAYTVGRICGKHKLIPWVSPGKTWEGFVGALLFAGGFAALFTWLTHHWPIAQVTSTVDGEVVAITYHYMFLGTILFGLIVAVLGHVGDLTMSLLKRDAGVKDSGKTIPGFGGVMDILDSPLLVAPIAYWLLPWIRHAAVAP